MKSSFILIQFMTCTVPSHFLDVKIKINKKGKKYFFYLILVRKLSEKLSVTTCLSLVKRNKTSFTTRTF